MFDNLNSPKTFIKILKPIPNYSRNDGQNSGVPREYDAVRGGKRDEQKPEPTSAVLGGKQGFKQNLANGNLTLAEALARGISYGMKREEIILAFNLGNKEFKQYNIEWERLLIKFSTLRKNLKDYIYWEKRDGRSRTGRDITDEEIENQEKVKIKRAEIEASDLQITSLQEKIDAIKK